MAVDTLLFVSKRASVAAAALLWLAATHLAALVTAGTPAQVPEMRVAITR